MPTKNDVLPSDPDRLYPKLTTEQFKEMMIEVREHLEPEVSKQSSVVKETIQDTGFEDAFNLDQLTNYEDEGNTLTEEQIALKAELKAKVEANSKRLKEKNRIK